MGRDYKRRYKKEYNLILFLVQRIFLYFIAYPIAHLYYNVKYEGRENFDKSKQYLFCPNHVSYLDPPFAALVCDCNVAYMAKQELFFDKNFALRWFVRIMGAFAVNREKPELSTFKTVRDVIDAKWNLGIFPQGKICHENYLSDVHKGFAIFSKRAKLDVVPIAICGFTGYAHRPFEKHMTLKIGKPISHELPEEEIIRQWANSICEMTGLENRVEEELAQEKSPTAV